MSTKLFKIRRLTASDAEVVSALAANDGAFELSDRASFFPPQYLSRWLSEPGDDLLVGAEVNGRLVGFILCQVIRREWCLWHNFYVTPEHRRRGIGKALHDHVMLELRRRKIAMCVAFTRDSGAIAFHSREGAAIGRSFTFVDWRVAIASTPESSDERK